MTIDNAELSIDLPNLIPSTHYLSLSFEAGRRWPLEDGSFGSRKHFGQAFFELDRAEQLKCLPAADCLEQGQVKVFLVIQQVLPHASCTFILTNLIHSLGLLRYLREEPLFLDHKLTSEVKNGPKQQSRGHQEEKVLFHLSESEVVRILRGFLKEVRCGCL